MLSDSYLHAAHVGYFPSGEAGESVAGCGFLIFVAVVVVVVFVVMVEVLVG